METLISGNIAYFIQSYKMNFIIIKLNLANFDKHKMSFFKLIMHFL